MDWHKVLTRALKKTLWFEMLKCAFLAFISESIAVFYSFFTGVMIRYIQDPDAPTSTGILYVVIFFLAQVFAQTLRANYIMIGMEFSIKMKRLLVGALYDKVTRLTLKSMAKCNSGKLISMVSGDLFAIERGFVFAPLFLAAPFINLVAYIFLAYTVGWEYTLLTLAFWFVLLFIQNKAS